MRWIQWHLVRVNKNLGSRCTVQEFHTRADALAALETRRRAYLRDGYRITWRRINRFDTSDGLAYTVVEAPAT